MIMDIGSIIGSNPLLPTKKKEAASGDLLAMQNTNKPKTSEEIAATKKQEGKDVVKEFMDFMNKSPAERNQEIWLRSHGISPEEFAAMSPDQKQQLMDQMKKEMQDKLAQESIDKFRPRVDISI